MRLQKNHSSCQSLIINDDKSQARMKYHLKNGGRDWQLQNGSKEIWKYSDKNVEAFRLLDKQGIFAHLNL